MATNLAINDELLNDALKIGGLKSKKDTVNTALAEFIQKRKAEDLVNMFGTVEYENGYDYKALRTKK